MMTSNGLGIGGRNLTLTNKFQRQGANMLWKHNREILNHGSAISTSSGSIIVLDSV